MSTHICFHAEIRKIFILFSLKKVSDLELRVKVHIIHQKGLGVQ